MFYDALAGGVENVQGNPELAALAHELVQSIKKDLTVDWGDRQATEAQIRIRIRRLVKRNRDKLHKTQPTGDGGGDFTDGAGPEPSR